MPSDNVALISEQIEALNRGDLEAAERGLDPEVVWVVAREHPAARTLRGLGELRAYRDDWIETLPGLHFDVDEIVERDDRVIVVGSVGGTGAGSGAGVTVPLAFVNHFSDGRIVRVEEFLDPREALDA